MKNSKSQLYELIRHLNPSEKRYFKLHTAKHIIGEQNGYLRLFDLICELQKKSDHINENELRKKISLIGEMPRLDLYKSNLYKKILEALSNYHRNKSISDKIHTLCTQAEILNQKELPYQALKLINKGIGLAKKYEKWYACLQLLELQRSINYSLQEFSIDNEEEKNILIKATNLSKYRKLQSKMWKLYLERGLPSNDQDLKKYQFILKNKLMEDEKYAESLDAKCIYLYLLQFYHGMAQDLDSTCKYGFELIHLLEKNPDRINADGGMYLRSLINLQLALMRLKKHKAVLSLISKTRTAIKKVHCNPALKRSIGLSLYMNELTTHQKLNPSNFQGPLIADFRKYYSINKNIFTATTKYLYLWQNASYHFNQGEYWEALDWLEDLKAINSDYREDIQSLARILLMIIHFELGNLQLVKYYVRSTYRYLLKKNHLFSLEKLLLTFVKKQLKMHENMKQDKKQLFSKLLTDLQKLKKDDYSHEALRSYNFEWWIVSKVENKPIVEVIENAFGKEENKSNISLA